MARIKQCSGRKRLDRLSELPDSVLCHILSFLPTNVSVSTSILSRRWRFLWTSVPSLEFDCEDYKTGFHHKISFSDIIYRVMMLNNAQNLDTFRLYCEDYNEYQLETWMKAATARKVRILDLFLPCQVMLPRCLFTCRTLVDLTLDGCVQIPWPSAMCFPSLKKVHLYCVRYDVDENLSHLISGCPVLEELIIGGILPQDLVFCNVSSSTIKLLTVMFQFPDTESNGVESDNHDYKLELNTPALRYIRVEDNLSEHISAHILTSLIEADISIKNKNLIEDVFAYSGSMLGFVDKLCNVRRLKLSIHYTKYIESAFSASTIKFHNLTKLELAAHLGFFSKFLENADNLQEIIIRKVGKEPKCWMEPQQVPVCLLSHLRTVRIDKFRYTEDEFEMVRYLLLNSQVLKRMEIYTKYHEDKKFSALRRISLFRRGSAACQVAFY